MKNFGSDGFYKKAKIFGIILVSISIAYYLIIFLPEKERYKRTVEEEKRIEQEVSKNKEELQKKNTECLSNSEKIKTKIKDDNALEMQIFGIKLFSDIFYSSKINSCVYVIKTITPQNFDNSEFSIINVSTDKIIESTSTSQEDYDRLIAKYKDANQE